MKLPVLFGPNRTLLKIPRENWLFRRQRIGNNRRRLVRHGTNGLLDQRQKLIASLDPKTGEAKEIIPIPEFKGLKLEGFTQKYDPEKKVWTYLDADGRTIAFWDEKGNEGKGRIELAEGIKEMILKTPSFIYGLGG